MIPLKEAVYSWKVENRHKKIELNAYSTFLNVYILFICIKFSLRKWNKPLYVENMYCY